MDVAQCFALRCYRKSRDIAMEDNNIIARIPGQYLAAAEYGLPDATTSSERELQAKADVPGHGRVLIIFERKTHKRGKNTHTWWCAKHVKVIVD